MDLEGTKSRTNLIGYKPNKQISHIWHHIQYITHLLFVSINLSLQGVSFSKILQSDKRENGSIKVTRQVETKILSHTITEFDFDLWF